MYKNVLSTAIEKAIFYNWLTKYNPIMHQSGVIWRNS